MKSFLQMLCPYWRRTRVAQGIILYVNSMMVAFFQPWRFLFLGRRGRRPTVLASQLERQEQRGLEAFKQLGTMVRDYLQSGMQHNIPLNNINIYYYNLLYIYTYNIPGMGNLMM